MQDKPHIEKYGLWPSPVGPEMIADQVVAYEALSVDPSNGTVYHVERRLAEGRSVLLDSCQKKDLIHNKYNCRSVVHGYGGAPVVIQNGVIYFTNVPDLRVYKIEGDLVTAVTSDTPQFRYANLTLHPCYSHIMIAIREDHTDPTPTKVVDTVVFINLNTGISTIISKGWDFYANPVFNPSGTKLAWLRWNHPDMPFRSTQLVVGEVCVSQEGQMSISNETIIAGEPHISVAQQALWIDDHTIAFLHDISGWMQPWIHFLGGNTRPILKKPILAEFSEAMWGLGMSSYAILDNDHLLCVVVRRGFASLIVVCISSGTFEELPSPFVDIKYVKQVRCKEVVFVGSRIDCGEAIVKMTLHHGRTVFKVLVTSSKTAVPDGFAAQPEPLVLLDPSGHKIHALFFPPTHPEFFGPQNEQPPCVVHFHAGPTSRMTPQFLWDRILYTSRGWAWLDVMYSGSSGYGRQYMEKLDGRAAELDVQECVQATIQTAAKGLIDINRVVITGSGGPSVLMSLINFPNFYAAGCSQFSVCDVAELYHKSPKLQLFYSALLLGGSPDELPEVYRARSPLFHAQKIKAPVLLAHGAQDVVIPVWQTDAIVAEIEKNGGHFNYLRFANEGHGFRQAETIRMVQEHQLQFFESVFGFYREQ
ncbi:Alpha/beta-hydrolase [Mycena venus]|uniref:Alpha/beta-hydrolase n=1 Tax=Mycena venus TaxID=2733690 RepID=A0A8H7CPS7_9AGAR|nr:Alpha/beta-hydrolase [Mycena venus]